MTDDVDLDTVMSRRFELDREISLRQAQLKESLAPLQEELTLCETYIKAELNKSGAQQWKSATTGHETHFTTKTSVAVPNWDAALAQIQSEGLWHFLTKALNKTAVKEYIDENKKLPDGVEFKTYKDLVWSRGKAAG